MIRGLLGLIIIVVALSLLPLSGHADEPPAYSVAEYIALRAAMSRADDRLAEADQGSLDYGGARAHLIARVDALINYLNGWMESGEMPADLAGEAAGQRFVLFENLVSLHADAGDCETARVAYQTLRALDPAGLGEDYVDLRDSAADVVASCTSEESVAPVQVAAPAAPPPSPRLGRALWVSGAAGVTSGVAVAISSRSERAQYEELWTQQRLEYSAERDLRIVDQRAKVERFDRAAVALIAGGSALVVAGALTDALLRRPANRRSQVQVGVLPSGLVLGARF